MKGMVDTHPAEEPDCVDHRSYSRSAQRWRRAERYDGLMTGRSHASSDSIAPSDTSSPKSSVSSFASQTSAPSPDLEHTAAGLFDETWPDYFPLFTDDLETDMSDCAQADETTGAQTSPGKTL